MSDVVARPYRTSTCKTPRICDDWFVEFKSVAEYRSPVEIERDINHGLLRISGSRTMPTNPSWELLRGNTAPAKNCYIYIFRKISGFATLWDELYLGEDGRIQKQFPPKNDRREASFVHDHIPMPAQKGRQRYTYYFWSSPFRLSSPCVTRLRMIIQNAQTDLPLYDLFTIMNEPTLDDQCTETGTPEGDVFTVFVPDYLGYAAVLYRQLRQKLADIHTFRNRQNYRTFFAA